MLQLAFSTFWSRHPALFYGLLLTLAILLSFHSLWALLPLSVFLFFCEKMQRIKGSVIILTAFLFVNNFYQFPPAESLGEAHFSIAKVKKAKRNGWVYQGTLLSFIPDGEKKSIASHLPCSFFSQTRVPADHTYRIHGTLKKGEGVHTILKSKEALQEGKKIHNLAELRFKAKEKLRGYFKTQFPHKAAATLLSGLFCGDLEDDVMIKVFEKRGLSHLLAISGFHFAIIALCFHMILRIWLPFKINAALLIALLTLYFLFIGNTPSVERAWVVAILFFLGQLLKYRTNGLNSLGVALLVALALNPLTALNIGFQLSFLATGALLLLSPTIKGILSVFFVKKGRVSKFFHETLSLSLAVEIALWPLLVLHFHKFPLHGLAYNLVFPVAITLSLLLLVVATILHFTIPIVGEWLHVVNSFYTEGVLKALDLSFFPHKTLYFETMPTGLLSVYLTALFVGAVVFAHKREKEREFQFF